jgi:hypothetical protein
MEYGIIVDYTQLAVTDGMQVVLKDRKVIQVNPFSSPKMQQQATLIPEEIGHFHTSTGNTVFRSEPIVLS